MRYKSTYMSVGRMYNFYNYAETEQMQITSSVSKLIKRNNYNQKEECKLITLNMKF